MFDRQDCNSCTKGGDFLNSIRIKKYNIDYQCSREWKELIDKSCTKYAAGDSLSGLPEDSHALLFNRILIHFSRRFKMQKSF
jgi:hypothetical protein